MPRKARERSNEAIYHIICRSVSEILLFKDDNDKNFYLDRLKRYISKNRCSLYAFCLMDSHLHLHLDPKGYDISAFMRALNTSYARYFNSKYSRHGPVFQGRFESRILSTDAYNFAVSAYIHNNPYSIEAYSGREEYYPFSSYGIYLGIRKDFRENIDVTFMQGLFNVSEKKDFARKYLEFVRHQRDVGSLKILHEKLSSANKNEYVAGRKIILRELPTANVISMISEKLIIDIKGISFKARYNLIRFRAFTAYVLRVLCGLSYKEICASMCNMTISGCEYLCNKGYELLNKDSELQKLFEELTELGVKAA